MKSPTTTASISSHDVSELRALVFDNSFGCVKILDLAGHLIEMNTGGRRALEVDDFEVLRGQSWANLWPVESQPMVRDAVTSAAEGGQAHFSGFCATAKGTPKWWNVDVTPLRNGSGNYAALLAVSHDVTELQAIRAKLEEIILRRDMLLQIGEIGEWSFDPDSGEVSCSASFDRCLGFSGSSGAWTYQRVLNLVHEANRARFDSRIRQAIQSKETLHDEYRVIWPDGTIHWISSIGTVHIANGVQRWLGVVQDITARKRAEAIERGTKLAFEKMVNGLSLAEILESLCYAAEDHFGERVFSCIMVADVGGSMLHHVASPSLPAMFRTAVATMPISGSAETCGKAAYTRESIYIKDIIASALPDDLKQLAQECGFRSCWTTPIISNEHRLLGTFALYYKSAPASIDNDQQVVIQIVNTIGLIIDRFQQAEQKSLMETAFRKAQSRLEATLKAVEVATWSYDIAEKRFYGDDNLRHLLSLSSSEANGGPIVELTKAIHPDDVGMVCDVIDKALVRGLPYETQYRVLSADSQYHTVLARAKVDCDRDGQPLELSGVLLDITRQQHAEESLRVSRERYHQLFRIMDQGLCILEIIHDQEGRPQDCRYIETNPAFEHYSGLQNVQGKTLRSILPAVEDFWIGMYARVSETGESVRFEQESKALGRWFDVYASRVDQDSKLVSVLFSDITARKTNEQIIVDYNKKLDREANYDALTGLPNRRLFSDRLAREIVARERDQRSIYLLFLDLDDFKGINDLLGHSAGDALLREVAMRLKACVRVNDTVARLGGDEFTIILVEDHDSHVEQIAQKILDKMSEAFFINVEQVTISCSIGITVYPTDARTADDLIRNADQAMYLSKANGRNQLTFFEQSMHAAAMERLRTISDLRDAVAGKQISLFFQPIVDMRTGRVSKAEALVRWHHPRDGLVLPSAFIALAEETGLIHDIGDLVLKKALTFIKKWQDQMGINIQISVNKSPKQFLKKDHTEEWLELIRESGVDGHNIVVEITESLLVTKEESVSENLRQLYQQGVRLSIDDFGTGYSSMGYLKRFDADYLKLDQSFVKNLVNLPIDTIIVETIIQMGHKLGLKIIAEGVETEQQRAWLEANQCDYFQGYLFSPPLPLEEFEKMLQREQLLGND